jgi:hypothetical protein
MESEGRRVNNKEGNPHKFGKNALRRKGKVGKGGIRSNYCRRDRKVRLRRANHRNVGKPYPEYTEIYSRKK